MADPTGGPKGGGLVEHETWAFQQIKENAAQRQQQQPSQETARPQETPAPAQAEADAYMRNLQENERRGAQQAQEKATKQQALIEAAQTITPDNSNRDQQLEQQQGRGGREM